MFEINGISDEPKQTFRLNVLNSDEKATLTMTWRDTQNAWFIDVSYLQFSVKNLKLCRSPNVLGQFKNRIPFGIACGSTNKQDPLTLESFRDKVCFLFTLTAEDTQRQETLYG